MLGVFLLRRRPETGRADSQEHERRGQQRQQRAAATPGAHRMGDAAAAGAAREREAEIEKAMRARVPDFKKQAE